jgi:hypothetical protein
MLRERYGYEAGLPVEYEAISIYRIGSGEN